jgi:hypothetical protein
MALDGEPALLHFRYALVVLGILDPQAIESFSRLVDELRHLGLGAAPERAAVHGLGDRLRFATARTKDS